MVPCPFCEAVAGDPCMTVAKGYQHARPRRAPAVHQTRLTAERQHNADLLEISGGVVSDLGAHRRKRAS